MKQRKGDSVFECMCICENMSLLIQTIKKNLFPEQNVVTQFDFPTRHLQMELNSKCPNTNILQFCKTKGGNMYNL